MHAKLILTQVLEPCLCQVHLKRSVALIRATMGLLCGGVSSLSGIALALAGGARLKHRVKSVDRLLGNRGLHDLRDELYRQVAHRWLQGLSRVLVVVDWSHLSKDQTWQCLRASVVVQGRSVTLYEQAHPQKKLGNPRVHREFLKRLAAILPQGCRPIVMSDAGFHAPWFKAVREMGWDFIGRVRGRNLLRVGHEGDWTPARELYERATGTAHSLGVGEYARSNPVPVQVVLAKRPNQGRHRLNIYGKKRVGRSSAKASRAAKEPWLLVYSPGLAHLQPQAVVKLYEQRMRIEQSFRDTKNLRWGQGLEVSRSRSRLRLEMLLLIAHLASLVQRLIGESAREHQLELQFMATRRKSRAEISVLTLARRIINAGDSYLKALLPWLAIPPLTRQAAIACGEAI